MSDVEMPALGESVTEGTVTRWLKAVGDEVAVDEPLLEVSTDKVDTEIPSPVAGTLQEILVEEDETVEVGATLARIGEGAAGGGDDGGSGSDDTATDAADTAGDESPADDEPADDARPAEEQAEAQGQQQDQQDQPDQGRSEDDEPKPKDDEPPKDVGAQEPPSGGGDGTPVTMPALGESVTEGTVTRWLKAEGDEVAVDEPLLEVSTDKVDTEIPSPVAGTVQKILVSEDETVEVGAQLAIVGTGAGGGQQESAPPAEQEPEKKAEPEPEAKEPEPEAKQPEPEPKQPEPEAKQPEPAAASSGGGQGGETSAYITPLVRKLAKEHEVDLSALSGTGVGGRIRKQDVLAAADKAKADKAPAQAPAASRAPSGGDAVAALAAKRGTTEKMSRLRKVIASRMVESLQTSAQLTTVVEVDVTKIARLRERAKRDFEAREGVKLSYLPFFALAAVEALKAHPRVNASIEGDEVAYHSQENLGMAVDTDRGLLVPVVRDAGDLNIAGLARKIADLAERTRTNKITPDELGGGTFTLTNTGSRGALFDTPIINQPQVAILGTGGVVRRAVVVTDGDGGETIAIRSMVYLALSYDHRLVDGADAARFLGSVKERLEEGAFDADLGL